MRLSRQLPGTWSPPRAGAWLARIQRSVAAHGVRGSAARAIRIAADHAYLHEQHVWYELPLDGRPPPELPDGMSLRTRRIDDAEHWELVDGDTTAFECFVFHRKAPVLAAEAGWLELPDGTVCLEDSITYEGYRGRGLAPAAWSAIAARLHGDGLGRMITKVGVENTPSRRAVTKAGFAEIALQDLRRVATVVKRVRVDVLAPGGDALRSALERS